MFTTDTREEAEKKAIELLKTTGQEYHILDCGTYCSLVPLFRVSKKA